MRPFAVPVRLRDILWRSSASATHRREPVVAVRLAILWLLVAVATTRAQDDAKGPDVEALKTRIAELEAVETPDDDQKAELAELKSAQSLLDQAAASAARSSQLADQARTAPDQLEAMQADLDKALADLETPISLELPAAPAEATADDMAAALAPVAARLESAQAQQEAARQLLEKARSDDDVEATTRRGAIPGQIAEATSRDQDVDQLISAMPADADASPLDKAKMANLRAEKLGLTARLAELDQELKTLEVTRTLRQARVDLAKARSDQADRVVGAVQEELDRRNSAVAARRTAEAKRARAEAISQHAVVRDILDRNAKLAAEQEDVASRRRATNAQLEEVQSLIKSWQLSFEQTRNQINRVGLNDVIGLRLRTLRAQLRALRTYERHTAEAWSEVKRAQLRSIELESLVFADVAAEAQRLLDASSEPVPARERDEILAAATQALTTQKDFHETLQDEYTESYIDDPMMKLHGELVALAGERDRYLEFIQQRILWIQSTSPIGLDFPAQVGSSLAWLLGKDRWIEVGRAAWQRVTNRPASCALWFAPFVVLIAMRRLLLRRLAEFAGKVRRASTDRFIYTVRAAFITVLLSLRLPALFWALAQLLSGADATADFDQGCAFALERVALALLSLSLAWNLCRPHGLGAAHFRWRQEHLTLLRRRLGQLTPIIVPMVFVLRLTDREAFQTQHDSLGRLAFCVITLALGYFTWSVLHPTRGVLNTFLAGQRGGWLDHLKGIWFPAVVTLPIGLGVAAGFGYFLTAVRMVQLDFGSVWLVVLAIVVFSVLLRWLYVAQRRLALEQMKRRFETEREAAKQAAAETEQPSDQPIPVQPDDELLDVEAVSAQTRRLLASGLTVIVLVGLYFIWADVLPAFGLLDEIPVWVPAGVTITVAEDGTKSIPLEVITLANIGFAALVLFVTLTLTRNLPGLLEILVLRRLPMSAGARYTTGMLVRYTILIVGLVLTFDAIGIGWSKVQWLAAAVSVGLGFGLQEIFANFVSGLIILTERPVRVGDTVTVAGVSGTVSRIQMRATTVTDWDRKELIIPNKEFVTGQIVNWTLSNPISRISIDVGIAYGSDTATAQRLLLEVARAEKKVLDDPAPRAFFIGFGDNSLNFQLRIYIDDVDNFSAIRDKVNMAIDQAFRKAGVEISFPQRDIHVRSIEGTLKLDRGGRDEESTK